MHLLDESPPASISAARPLRSRRPASRLRRDLRAIFLDGVMWSLMVGLAEWYLALFALAIGHREVVAGLITTLPLLLGAGLQLVSPTLVRRLGSLRRWVVLCVLMQAISLLPFAVAAGVGQLPLAPLFLFAALYWGAGMGSGPAWTTWMGFLVPRRIRARFFARRSRAIQAGQLLGILIAGVSLQWGEATGRRLPVFVALFTLAAVCRFVSARLLAGQSEPSPLPSTHRAVSLRELFARGRHTPAVRLLLYMLAVQAAAYVSGPFFSPFMRKQLHLQYLEITFLVSATFIAKIIAFPLFGKVAHRVSSRTVLWIGGVGLAPLSVMWTFSHAYGYLMLVQVLAGVAWAAYELATFLLTFELIPEEERTSILTFYTFGQSLAMVGGSLLGGAILNFFHEGHAGYLLIFALSSAARAATVWLLWRGPGAARRAI